jgi:hypothetical protein
VYDVVPFSGLVALAKSVPDHVKVRVWAPVLRVMETCVSWLAPL